MEQFNLYKEVETEKLFGCLAPKQLKIASLGKKQVYAGSGIVMNCAVPWEVSVHLKSGAEQ
ncbi:hypothetical protein A1A1_12237 [Planococcus antarcticus DSM 14505]|uniref:Uncharacterized protein n=1 Tax=Planococcus antarcticus DSM 14505 TaxID=1185653 RepID=A0A1C7DFA8_9BACL|nr:hypothetical protein BBH88_07380 [Planococcus antarcticus DSM 14505]EIM06221.1 hypothetical protein A1A1_12237 [Planococcus antarcticus DSM 14505]